MGECNLYFCWWWFGLCHAWNQISLSVEMSVDVPCFTYAHNALTVHWYRLQGQEQRANSREDVAGLSHMLWDDADEVWICLYGDINNCERGILFYEEGEIEFRRWFDSEPSTHTGTFACAVITPSGVWSDLSAAMVREEQNNYKNSLQLSLPSLTEDKQKFSYFAFIHRYIF